MTDAAVAVQPPTRSWWEDVLDMFYSPSTAMQPRSNGRFGMALLVITIVFGVLNFAYVQALAPVFEAETARQMAEQTSQMTPEQQAQARSIGRIITTVGFAIAFPIGMLLTGLIVWGLGRLFGVALTAGVAIAIVLWAQVVRVLGYWVGMMQRVVTDVEAMDSIYDITLSPARFLDREATGEAVMVLASRFDIFTLWVTALIAIGLQAAAGAPRAKAWTIAALAWFLAGLPQLLGALIGG